MKPIFHKLLASLAVILIPTIFCILMATPFSFLLPLNYPQELRVIGIECFDSNYINTTPWYRKGLGASELTFPFLLGGFTIIARWKFIATPTSEFDRSKKIAPGVAPRSIRSVQSPTGSNWDQVKQSVETVCAGRSELSCSNWPSDPLEALAAYQLRRGDQHRKRGGGERFRNRMSVLWKCLEGMIFPRIRINSEYNYRN